MGKINLWPWFVPGLYMLANFLLYRWFVRFTRPSPVVRRGIGLLLFAVVLLFPVSKILGQKDFNAFNQTISLVSSTWMGLCFYFTFFAAASMLLSLALRRIPSFRFSRLSALRYRRMAAAIIVGTVIALAAYASFEAREVGITRMEIPLRKLPPELDGLALVQLSDIHYGMVYENGRLEEIVRRVNELQPDLVVITGDLVDERVAHMEEMAIPLSRLAPRLGVFACMGNHEFFAGVDRAEQIMRRAGIRVLRNEAVTLPGGLQILGIDDPTVLRRNGLPLPDFERLVAGLDPEKPSILLYHQPREFEKTAAAGIGLQLSGHTHGAQLLPMRPVAGLLFPFLRGHFELQESHLYVSRGVGTGGPPMRHGSPPEIVFIQLKMARR